MTTLTTTLPGYQRLTRVVLAASIVGGPLAFFVGGMLSPAIHESGQATLDANEALGQTGNAVRLAAFFAASFLLPLSAMGLARLAYDRAPWLATIGGLIAVLGWLPFSALTALDDLGVAMLHPSAPSNAELLDRFSTGLVMNNYLIIYIIGHLVAYILLGIALHQAGAVPAWAAWAMALSSPMTVAAFVLPGRPIVVGTVALGMLVLASLPAAASTLRRSPRQ
jgi:hypothetical protein